MNAPRDPWGSGTPEASGGDLLPSLAPGMSGGSEATDHPVFDGSEAGRYAQTTLLGRGSMGRVVGALDRRLGRMVAVKIADGTDTDRFAREARLAGRLDHPGIVTVHDSGRGADGRPFYVMRLVRGHTLQDELLRAGPADRVRLIRALLDAARAVAHAHDAGIVHRDLKPANLLLSPRGDLQVGDWGLARDLALTDQIAEESGGDAFATRLGAVLGTPAWISPEAAAGQTVGLGADVFALGAMLNAVLGGGPPWGDGDADALLVRAQLGVAAPVPADVPPDLAAIVARATRADPAQRYPDAGALSSDLSAWLDGERVTAHEYTSAELARRLLKRFRAPLTVGAVALGLLGLGAANATWRIVAEQQRAVAAEGVAEDARQQADARLASSLTLQAVSAAADRRWPEAEVFAAHAVALTGDLRARGVLAAVAAVPSPRLVSTEPLPCERPQPDPLARAVLCADATKVEVYDLPWRAGAAPRWTQAHPPLRPLWRGLEGRMVGLHVAPGEQNGLMRWSGRDGMPTSFSPIAWQLVGHDVLGVPSSSTIAWPSVGHLVWDDGVHVGRTRFCAEGGSDRGATWLAEGARVAVVCEVGRTIVEGPPQGPARVVMTLPPEVDANTVLAVHHDGGEWTLALFGGFVVSLDDAGRVRWRRELPIGNVRAFAARPGLEVAVLSGEGGPLLLDLRTGDPLARLPAMDAGPMQLVKGDDGWTLHTWGRRHAVWALAPERLPPVVRMDAGLSTAAWSPDGASLAVADGDGDVQIVRESGAPLAFRWQSLVVKSLGFLPSGELISAAMGTVGLALLSPEGELREVLPQQVTSRRVAVLADGSVWTTPMEAPPLHWRRGPDGWTAEAFAGYKGEDAEASADGQSVIFVADGRVLRAAPDEPVEIANVPGAQVAAQGPDGQLVLGLLDRVLLCAPDCQPLDVGGRVQDASFSADGWLALGLVSGEVSVWRPGPAGLERYAVLPGHTDRVAWTGWRPGRRELATVSWDGTARRWRFGDLPTAEAVEARWGIALGELWE